MVDLAHQHLTNLHRGAMRGNFDRCGGWAHLQGGWICDWFGRVLRSSAPANLTGFCSAHTGGASIKIG